MDEFAARVQATALDRGLDAVRREFTYMGGTSTSSATVFEIADDGAPRTFKMTCVEELDERGVTMGADVQPTRVEVAADQRTVDVTFDLGLGPIRARLTMRDDGPTLFVDDRYVVDRVESVAEGTEVELVASG